MKKYFTLYVLILTFLLTPLTGHAQQTTNTEAIQALLIQQIEMLQNVVALLLAQQEQQDDITTTTESIAKDTTPQITIEQPDRHGTVQIIVSLIDGTPLVGEHLEIETKTFTEGGKSLGGGIIRATTNEDGIAQIKVNRTCNVLYTDITATILDTNYREAITVAQPSTCRLPHELLPTQSTSSSNSNSGSESSSVGCALCAHA